MKAAIIYFSGTGNTEYVARKIKETMENNKIECTLIDIRKKKKLTSSYDIYIFGSSVYWGMFPEYFIQWVTDNIAEGAGKKAMVFSTQAGDFAPGIEEIDAILKNKGFDVVIMDCIEMPNNYYVAGYKRNTSEEIDSIKKGAQEKAELFAKNLINEVRLQREVPRDTYEAGVAARKKYGQISKVWAKDNITIDHDLCVKCGKCVKNCPVKNISMTDEVVFDNKCMSCQRCIHSCPVNAFLFRNNRILQYKI